MACFRSSLDYSYHVYAILTSSKDAVYCSNLTELGGKSHEATANILQSCPLSWKIFYHEPVIWYLS